MTPTIDATADHLSGNSQGDRGGNDVPVDVVGNPQSNDKWDGKVDENKPADGILGGPLAQVAKRNVAQYSEDEHADQSDVDFDVQE